MQHFAEKKEELLLAGMDLGLGMVRGLRQRVGGHSHCTVGAVN
jgi:hypothetical protein